ncbi:MAG: hypothetical protein HY791_01235 [Deltaproteobacteria bacterium]|nr:hypothetical protein [Deltaproteobacteria bacterium]
MHDARNVYWLDQERELSEFDRAHLALYASVFEEIEYFPLSLFELDEIFENVNG